MEINSRYSKSFYSDRLSNTKYNEIYSFALSLNTIKNEISTKVNKNLFQFLEMSKFEFSKFINSEYKNRINSNFIYQLSDDIYTSYQNKFDNINKRLKFEVIYDYQINLYKRKTKDHNIGDFKGISKKYKSTPLSLTLTYLIRYGNENILEYLNNKIKIEEDDKKLKFYQNILKNINKYGLNRLLNLAISKRNRIIKKYSEHPIFFYSKTFRGRSRLTSDIISYNNNFNSIINSFINISWSNNHRKKLTVPIKYSKDYHKDMKRYTKLNNTQYTLCFEENNEIRIILSYEDKRYIPENKSNFVGIDVNSKHNLFQCSNNLTIDYDRKLLEILSKEYLKLDKLKENKEYVIGKRKLHKIKHLERELHSKIRNSISDLCKSFDKKNIDHAVFEDLTGFENKCFIKDDNDINYNRRIKLLKLSSLKDEFEHIARKYDICTSLVHSYYTSQQCPHCGHIDSENRKDQEHFECINCGYTANADLNASKNILQRLTSTVLRSELLKNSKLGNGTFEPKNLNKEKVKEVLLSLRFQT